MNFNEGLSFLVTGFWIAATVITGYLALSLIVGAIGELCRWALGWLKWRAEGKKQAAGRLSLAEKEKKDGPERR